MTVQNSENHPETEQRTGQSGSLSGPQKASRLAKTHQDYWLARLKKRVDRWHSQTV